MHDGKIHTFKGNIAETTRKSTGILNFKRVGTMF